MGQIEQIQVGDVVQDGVWGAAIVQQVCANIVVVRNVHVTGLRLILGDNISLLATAEQFDNNDDKETYIRIWDRLNLKK